MTDVYLEEYSSSNAVQRYVPKTAGSGIAYVLQNIYGPLYAKIANDLVGQKIGQTGFRVLEYGCGGGMNLLWIVRHILDRKLPIDLACGTDFAPQMIEAAKKECTAQLAASNHAHIAFHAVANENLVRDLPAALGRPAAEILGSFHLIVGVNTFRYCFRLRKQAESARGIFSLLCPGGYTVMIDMNHDFPFFRSRFRNRRGTPKEQYYLPTLEEYAIAFRDVGFEITARRNFCWIPHSGGPAMTKAIRVLAPLLDLLFPRFATRSLIVARKPD
jgi:SAM-dependent methyltransferase